jgi:hypothetical protein
MAFFGFGWKRNNPGPPQASAAPLQGGSAAPGDPADPPGVDGFIARYTRAAAPKPAARAQLPQGVEVRELNLDDNDFSSTFGPGSQFPDVPHGPGHDEDPWKGLLRVD